MTNHYHLGLLCLTHLLICADGVVDVSEIDALTIIKKKEGINDETFNHFQKLIANKHEKDIYHLGVEFMNKCSDREKLNVFVTLYKLSEVDGRVHVKEIRLLLYSIKVTGVDFNDVVNEAMAAPSII
jgi:uncharacterized tellurite resistance protein B-like protein